MLRTILAVTVAKIIIWVSRQFGNQGTVLAGRVARWLDPGILKKLAARVEKEIIIITGTNGKTTTSNMIAHILQANEHSVVHNRAGANMLNGNHHGVYRGHQPARQPDMGLCLAGNRRGQCGAAVERG
ncbi:MAG: Mur ligase family protein [Syntrophomonadaceae bacterium]